MNTGKWLILGIFAVALFAGVAAWVNRYYRTDAVQTLWGEKALDLIANAPQVDVIRVKNAAETDVLDATRAKGMLNVRYMLGSDFAYDFVHGPAPGTVSYPWKLEFHGTSDDLVCEFTEDCTIMQIATSGKSVRLIDAAAKNLWSFFEEQFPQDDGVAR